MKTNIDLKALKSAMDTAKQQLIADINNIDFSIPGVDPISDSPRIFTVKLSTIADNNHILSPEYYDAESQKQHVFNIINKNDNVLETIEKLKSVVNNKKFADKTPLHPNMINALSAYLDTIENIQGDL